MAEKITEVKDETIEYVPDVVPVDASNVQDEFLYGKSIEKLSSKEVSIPSRGSDWAIFNTGGGSIANNTQTNPTWSAGSASKSSMLGTNQFILPSDGVYQFTGTIRWNSNANGYRQALLLLNGSFITASLIPNNGGAADEYNIVSAIFYGYSGNSVRLEVFQTSGASISLLSSCRMGIFKVS